MEECLNAKKSNEALLISDAEKNMAHTTQFVYDVALSAAAQTKIISNDIISVQKQLQSNISSVNSRLDNLMSTSIELTKEMKRMEIEATSLQDLESWILITTSEFSHMKAQIKLIDQVIDDTSKKQTSAGKPDGKKQPI